MSGGAGGGGLRIRRHLLSDKLLADLHAVVKWSTTNNMMLNQSKFQLLQHGMVKSLKVQYSLNKDIIVSSSPHVKDLGVYMSVRILAGNTISAKKSTMLKNSVGGY